MSAYTECSANDQMEYRLCADGTTEVASSVSADELVSHVQSYLDFDEEQKADALSALAQGKDVIFNTNHSAIYILCGVAV